MRIPTPTHTLAILGTISLTAHASSASPNTTTTTTTSTNNTNTPMTCQEILIPVSATADNILLPDGLDWRTATDAVLQGNVTGSTMARTRVGGEYVIAGRYCEPVGVVDEGDGDAQQRKKRAETLQVLVHGATYTKDYWSGLAPPLNPNTPFAQAKYSYIHAAAHAAFPTLSLDRLCNGASTHANALLECQIPLQAATIAQILASARRGTLPISAAQSPNSNQAQPHHRRQTQTQTRTFTSLILTCHSLGSLICNALSATYPSAADALVLTGYTPFLAAGLSGIATHPLFLPAPDKPLGYLSATREAGAEYLFYATSYDRVVSHYDFTHRGSVTVGEIASVGLGQVDAGGFRGAVLVLNGDEDAVFCQRVGVVGPVFMARGECEKGGFSEAVRGLYGGARAFAVVNLGGTGHCVNNHYTAEEAFARVNGWLGEVGF
ncbi:hypothetical protein EJ05DRAFT_511973 [Pseudovirgaria hyperparasitica]|uniref:AB hydrolase-1 domain-containing protein n=1 Tax=Pseudovirgaria hyperparasitica TaxID=470096 RepID=A0A6A6W6R6_9PEZI|nr:uncharacterized protein EJ05DRAFT_511973 [Pseudovirgaria hyperparasitica]KAF2757257.1 hypothetical protein EJ05DRAFT_511973 [Pseudovirgaria hyperparasitica]